MVLVAACLAVLGAVVGSFAGVLAWRLKHKQNWIRGRSQCESCHQSLGPVELIPIAGWLLLRGRCRYCKKAISYHYLLLELAAAAVFVWSYVAWPEELHGAGLLNLVAWLTAAAGLLALALYDLRWQILPNKIIYPTLLVAASGRAAAIIAYAPDKATTLLSWLAAVAVASGFFWLLWQLSKGKWIGYGDVRLGLITGSLLAKPELAMVMILLASLLGTLVNLPLIAAGRRKLASRVPFGPFLIAATFLTLLYGESIINWYKELLV